MAEMKYRKKQVTIEAWRNDGVMERPAWVEKAFSQGLLKYIDDNEQAIQVCTLEDGHDHRALHYASPGDWIIQGVKGELYPCKPDIFELTYEPAPWEV